MPVYFTGGMYALGAKSINNQVSTTHLEIAEGLANTCHESYARTPTGLGPESFRFTEGIEARALKSSEKYYILRPEVIESWFYMWRYTKDPKYREWAWNAVLVRNFETVQCDQFPISLKCNILFYNLKPIITLLRIS